MRYFIIAGEASGDLHASNLMQELKKQDSNAEFCFLGGDLMTAQGGQQIKHYRQMAFMGFVAVLLNAKTILKNMDDCKSAISAFKPDVVILVDYPSFNLRIAKFVKENFKTPVYYYISPKIWAWKEYRIKEIKKYIDKMFTIFPFETEFYANHNYKVDYIGNPTVDSISNRPNQEQSFQEFCKKNDLSDKPIIALLAGSRKQEISACLARMMEAAENFSEYQVVISGAPGIDKEYYQTTLKNSKVRLVFDQTYDLLQHSDAAIVNSGTATLEAALIGTPQVVVYYQSLGRLAYLMKNLVIKVKYISLVNLIAEKEVVKELIAHLFTVKNMTAELEKILKDDSYRKKMIAEYGKIKNILGEKGAATKAAEKIKSYLNN